MISSLENWKKCQIRLIKVCISWKGKYLKLGNIIQHHCYWQIKIRVCQIIECDKRVWYLPYHSVYHSKRPHKLRVALDVRRELDERSIHKDLRSGLYLGNQLVVILTGFREKQVALMVVLEKWISRYLLQRNMGVCCDFFGGKWQHHGWTNILWTMRPYIWKCVKMSLQ